jgi:hypothetical protein
MPPNSTSGNSDGKSGRFPQDTVGRALPVHSYIIVCMHAQTLIVPTRRPRFRRASEPLAFRLTDDDVEIVPQLARHRHRSRPDRIEVELGARPVDVASVEKAREAVVGAVERAADKRSDVGRAEEARPGGRSSSTSWRS